MIIFKRFFYTDIHWALLFNKRPASKAGRNEQISKRFTAVFLFTLVALVWSSAECERRDREVVC